MTMQLDATLLDGLTEAMDTARERTGAQDRATRVLVVDDHAVLAQSLAFSLRAAGLVAHVAVATTPAAIVDAAATFGPDVIVLDLMLGDEVGRGRDLVGPLRKVSGAQVLMLTGVTDRVELAACVEAGAVGLASKGDGFERVLEAVLAVAAGRNVMRDAERLDLLQELRESRASERRRHAPFLDLTRREQEVLQGLVDGKSLQEIAHEAFVGVGTVRTQAKAIFRKLGVRSQIAAVAAAHGAGWSLDPASVPA